VPGLREALTSGPDGKWDKVTVLPLPLSVSPMTGWVDAADFVSTKYALLLHNDGYALDPFFTCELVRANNERRGERERPIDTCLLAYSKLGRP